MNSQEVITNSALENGPLPPPSADLASKKKMDHSLAHSIAWRAVTNWASQILSWASLLVVVRLLAPADFGIAAMAITFFPYLRYLSEIGIPATVVTFRDMSEDQLAQLNTVGLALGVGCFCIAVLLAHPLAVFFHTPRLAPVAIVACLALIPQGFRTVSEGLLNKDMRFGLLSWFEAIRAIVAAVTTLVLAYAGMGYWALILGNLLATLVRSVLIVGARPYRFAIPHVSAIRKELKFGWHVLVSVAAWTAYERLDNVTAGRVLGQAALGFYATAWNLANVPLEKVTTLVTTVIPTYLAAVQNNPAELRRYLRTLTETVAVATFPATIGLGLVARDLIPVALGQKWSGAVAPMEVLAVYAAFRSIVALLPKVLTAKGNARFVMWNDVFALIILPTAFYLGSRWGIEGIAWGWVVAYPFVAFPLYRKTFRTIGMRPVEYFRGLLPALEATIVMAITVGLVKYSIPAHRLAIRLLVEIAAGGAAYLSILIGLHRERVTAWVRIFRRGPKQAG